MDGEGALVLCQLQEYVTKAERRAWLPQEHAKPNACVQLKEHAGYWSARYLVVKILEVDVLPVLRVTGINAIDASTTGMALGGASANPA